ncbi:MAG: hypothetical protein U0229_19465 [Anaeromyxobacter sp.]
MDAKERKQTAERAGELLLAGDRKGAVATVRSLFTLAELRELEAGEDEDARAAARLLVAHFMPATWEEAEFLVAFALRWTRER